MSFKDKTYNVLKFIALHMLPAIGTLYFALSKFWGFPYAEEVVGTISAIGVFIGTLIGISAKNYKGDGVFEVDAKNPDTDIFNLNLNIPVEELPNKKSITFKVDTIK